MQTLQNLSVYGDRKDSFSKARHQAKSPLTCLLFPGYFLRVLISSNPQKIQTFRDRGSGIGDPEKPNRFTACPAIAKRRRRACPSEAVRRRRDFIHHRRPAANRRHVAPRLAQGRQSLPEYPKQPPGAGLVENPVHPQNLWVNHSSM